MRCNAPAMNFFSDMQKGLAGMMAGGYDEAAVKAALERPPVAPSLCCTSPALRIVEQRGAQREEGAERRVCEAACVALAALLHHAEELGVPV